MNKDEAFLKRLLATFRVEASEHIAAITSGLIELEATPSPARKAEVIETVFREAHSMKGAARSVNLTDIETVCQSLESVLAALKRKELDQTRALLDLLHKTLNLLGELLAAVGTGGGLPEKARVRALTSELNEAAMNSLRPGTGPGKEAPAPGLQPSPAGETAFPSVPGLSSVPSDAMRISKLKLDSILLQGEGFLSVKQTVAHQKTELRKIREALASFKKEWVRIQPELRAVRAAEKSGNGTGGAAPHVYGKKLIDFLELQEDRIAKLSHSFAAVEKTAAQDQRSIEAMVDSLLDNLKTVSLLPFSSLLEIVPKIVRDLSNDQDKEIAFTAGGGDIEIDKRILDEIKEPLIHLIRNCIDHGIEKPAERAAHKKPKTGTITVSVSHRVGKSVEVVVSDDGRGIDTVKILDSVSKLGDPFP